MNRESLFAIVDELPDFAPLREPSRDDSSVFDATYLASGVPAPNTPIASTALETIVAFTERAHAELRRMNASVALMRRDPRPPEVFVGSVLYLFTRATEQAVRIWLSASEADLALQYGRPMRHRIAEFVYVPECGCSRLSVQIIVTL